MDRSTTDRSCRAGIAAIATTLVLLLPLALASPVRAGDFGACCIDPTGGCCVTTPDDCDAIGGSFQGLGATCEATCPIVGDPTGACCFGGEGCDETVESECVFKGLVGTVFFPGQSCAETACPGSFEGACCLPGGTCAIDFAENCDATGGTYFAQQSCTCVFCPVFGACCLEGGGCSYVSEEICTASDGIFIGENTGCNKDGCPQDIGACCIDDACEIAIEADCAAHKGTFFGDGSSCSRTSCLGGCCLDNGDCSETTMADCTASEGTFLGAGTGCEGLTEFCPVLTGACCLPNGTCDDEVTGEDCDQSGGEFDGFGTTCVPGLCVPVGACCLSATGLEVPCADDFEELACIAADGVYVGDGTICKGNPCIALLGACCFEQDPCFDALAPECAIVGGSFIGAGIPCANGPCPQPGDCCNFEEATEFIAAGEANIEAVGDFNQDGLNDVVILGAAVGPATLAGVNGFAQVFLNLGNGAGGWLGFQALPPIAVGNAPSGIDAGDLDGNGSDDFALTNQGDDNVFFFLNDGNGTGTFLGPFVTPLAPGSAPSAIAIADVVGDSLPDLIVALENLNTVVILRNNAGLPFAGPPGGAGFEESNSIGVGDDPTSLDPEDLDNDKDTDVVVANTGDNTIIVIRREADGFSTSAAMGTGTEPVDVDAADIDGDGDMDIVTANRGGNSISIIENNGSTTLGGAYNPAVNLSVGALPLSIKATDLDGDGDRDLAVIASDSQIGPAVQVLANLGSQQTLVGLTTQFSLPVSIPIDNADPNFVVNTDLNGDGIDDLVTVNADTNPTGGSVAALINEFICVDVDCNLNGIPDGCESQPEPLAPASGGAADHCAAAQLICPGVAYDDSTDGATNGGELIECGGTYAVYDVNYRYRPKGTDSALVSVVGSQTPTIVSVHTGCPPTFANRVACAAPPLTDAVFTAQQNQEYWIVVATVGAQTGSFQLQLTGPDCVLNPIDLNENLQPDECECLADVDSSGMVDVFDAIIVSAAIGFPCNDCPEDLDFDGDVDLQDVLIVWSNIGRCPSFVPPPPNVGANEFVGPHDARPAPPVIPTAIPNP